MLLLLLLLLDLKSCEPEDQLRPIARRQVVMMHSGLCVKGCPHRQDLVTPLKGHSLSPRSCPATRSAPSERFGYVEAA